MIGPAELQRSFANLAYCLSTITVLAAGLLGTVPELGAAEPPIDYEQSIKPVLRERCYACHGALKQEGGLRLDTAALAVQGGDSGAAIEPGDVENSLLWQRVSEPDESLRMPPEGEALKPDQLAALRTWIEQNATGPSDEAPEQDPQEHWAFKPPVRPSVPQVAAESWSRNPVDAFLAHEHEKHGLTAQSAADKRLWLRRVSLDLIGLPPTTAEQEAFLADDSPEAYDNVVTRLLDSPQYGQRWGRHWMDIWRYSDWWGLGAEVRNSQKHMWHWRDWIVESLNADKGYDQMLREMLAADELYPNDLDRLRATGYLARQYFIFNRTTWLDETIEHTAKGMLGLTFNCAKCHDHKYDPLTQDEYYELRAIFEPYQVRTEMVPGEIDFEKNGIPRAFDAHLDVPTYVHVRGDDRNPDESRVMLPDVPAFLTSAEVPLSIQPIELPIEATYPGLRDFVVQSHREAAQQQLAAAHSALQSARAQLAALQAVADAESSGEPSNVELAAVVQEDFSAARPELWQMGEGSWSYREGRLVQSQAGPLRAALRLQQLPPVDFEARLTYVPTGGEMWKSVGIAWDITDQGNELLAYVSAYAGGAKSQIAYRQNGAYVYPPAAQSREVVLGQPHELVLRVRGGLLNLEVDGEHSIAMALPAEQPRQIGHLELIAFDATAEFVSFELRPLAEDIELVPANTPAGASAASPTGPSAHEQARLNVTIAERALESAEAQVASVEARAAADRATLNVSPDGAELPAAKDLAAAAARSERVVTAARTAEELSRAELALLVATSDKKAEAEKKVADTKTALDAARNAIEQAGDSYTPLLGAKKTQEDYQNRNADKPFPRSSSGRRTAFATWLTDPRHPLPARVAVNHIWARHMGQPLVPTVFDFGRKGTPPTHPELLDWLAVELTEHNWSMKHLHRLIVTSQAYRMSSSSAGAAETNLKLDPDNRYYWRMNSLRMEAQVVRDSLLHLAGELDVSLGGPSIPIADETSRRRSMYFVHSHNDHHKFLSMFDDASVLDCYRRAQSIVPQQALALENSSLASEMAEKIAARIVRDRSDIGDDEFIRLAFRTVLSVEPTTEEQTLIARMLPRFVEAAQASNRPAPELYARVAVVHALLNHNDFVTIR